MAKRKKVFYEFMDFHPDRNTAIKYFLQSAKDHGSFPLVSQPAEPPR